MIGSLAGQYSPETRISTFVLKRGQRRKLKLHGKKSRRGTVNEHSYTNISYLLGRDPVIEEVSTDGAKKQIVRLFKCGPIH